MKIRIQIFFQKLRVAYHLMRSERYALLTRKKDGTLKVQTHNLSDDGLINWAETLYEGSKTFAEMEANEKEAQRIANGG